MTTAVENALSTDLTHAFVTRIGERPLQVGSDFALRMQRRRNVSDDGVATTEAVAFADDAVVVVTIYDEASGIVLLTRTSGVEIADADPAMNECDIDTDQSAEDVDAGTGLGWFEWSVSTTDAEQQIVSAAVGTRRYKVEVTEDGLTTVIYAGRIEVGR